MPARALGPGSPRPRRARRPRPAGPCGCPPGPNRPASDAACPATGAGGTPCSDCALGCRTWVLDGRGTRMLRPDRPIVPAEGHEPPGDGGGWRSMIRRASGELEQAKRLERGLVIVRWVGIVLGVYLISQTNTGTPPYGGSVVVVLGQGLMALLAAWNVAVWLLTERLASASAMRRLGLACFAVDAAVVFGI